MWKALIYTALVEVCLFGVGLLTVPVWIDENVGIWLPCAVAVLLIMMCWEHWPRWMQFSRSFFWADMSTGARYYRDLVAERGMRSGVKMFDSMSSPHPNISSYDPVASAFRWIVQEAVNEGLIEVWGVPENGSRRERIVQAEDSTAAYRKSREGDALFLMMGGVYYRDLLIKRSTIKSYVEHVREHDAELKRRAEKAID